MIINSDKLNIHIVQIDMLRSMPQGSKNTHRATQKIDTAKEKHEREKTVRGSNMLKRAAAS